MSDITLINDSEQSSLVTNGLAKNGELYLKKAGSTDAGSIVVYDSGAWKTFANEYAPGGLVNDYSLSFDGTNDFVNLGTDTSLDVAGSDFSVALWFKHSNTSNSVTDGLLTIGTFTNKFFVGLGNGTANVDKVSFGYGAGSLGWYFNAGSGLNDSEWHLFVATVSSGTVTIYVDAVSESYSTGGAAIGAYNYLGRGNYGYYGGKLDNIAVFNSALSSSEVSSIYSAGRQGNLSSYSPVGWWKGGESDSGTGTTLTDDSTNSNTGTLSNGATFVNSSNLADTTFAIPSAETYRESAFNGSLLDGGTTGSWYAHTGSFNNTGWIGQDFGSGNSKAINSYRILMATGSSSFAPKDWTIEASNTGAFSGEEVTLDTRTGETSWTLATSSNYGSAWNEYTFTNSTAYRYWRINITANNGHGTYLIVTEMEMFEI